MKSYTVQQSPTPPGHAGTPIDVKIRALAPVELPTAAALLAHGMRDNPLHVKVFGGDPEHRQRRLQCFLGQLVTYVQSNGMLLGAFAHNELLGVLGMLQPGRCQPGWRDTLRFAGTVMTSNTPTGTLRLLRWLSAWSRNDPVEPHWHLGPMAVRPAFRRQGIARRLMMHASEHVDTLNVMACLETDLAINAAFYETLDFVVTRQQPVLGVRNWFMRRPPNPWNPFI